MSEPPEILVQTMDEATKNCAACGEDKPYSEFHKDSRKPDGRRSRCKLCTNADQRAFQQKHKAETGQYYSRTFRYERTCETCGKQWESPNPRSRYCSGTCANAVRVYQVICEECGKAFTCKTTQVRWCSRECAHASQFSKELVLRAPTPWWATRSWPTPRPTRCWYAGQCRRCSIWFVSDQPENRYCTRQCGRSDAKARRRARKKNAYVADVSRTKIFERDGWTCQLCHRKVNRRAVVPHPKAPVLDHIIPLDDGGTHEPANVQCAHFLCNSVKGARGGGEQLLLIG